MRLCPALLGRMPASAALAAFLRQLVEYAADNRGLASALNAGLATDSTASSQVSRLLIEAFTLLRNAGIAEKSLRSNVEPATILIVISGLCAAQDDPGWKQQAQAVVSLLLDGLRCGINSRGSRDDQKL